MCQKETFHIATQYKFLNVKKEKENHYSVRKVNAVLPGIDPHWSILFLEKQNLENSHGNKMMQIQENAAHN